MQIEQLLFNPYLYQSGGDISGDYKFEKGTKITMKDDADIELEEEESRLQMKSDPNNYLCFRDQEMYINLDLEVGGTLHANVWDIGTIELTNLTVTGQTNLKATTIDGLLTITKDGMNNSIHTTGRVTATEFMNGHGGLTQAELYHTAQLRAPKVITTTIEYNDAASTTAYITMAPAYIHMAGEVVYTGSLKFTGLSEADIIDWPLAGKHIDHMADMTHGVKVYADSTHSAEGTLEAHTVASEQGTFTNATFGLAGHGNIDFTDVDHIDFTGLTISQIHGWPLPGLHNAADSATGVKIYSDSNHTVEGLLEAKTIATETFGTQNATFGVEGAGGLADFRHIGTLDFTGVTAAQFINWPFVHPDGLQHVHDIPTGASIDGVLKVSGNAIAPTQESGNPLDLSGFSGGISTHKVTTDYIESYNSNFLNINGFSQVKIQHDFNVLGTLWAQAAEVIGLLDGSNAIFTNDVQSDTFHATSRMYTHSVGHRMTQYEPYTLT